MSDNSICKLYHTVKHKSSLSLALSVSPFQAESTVTITCANGKWNKQVSCEPVDCGLPDKYHVHPAHFTFPEGTTYGKRSKFRCKEPAQLIGKTKWSHNSFTFTNSTHTHTMNWCSLGLGPHIKPTNNRLTRSFIGKLRRHIFSVLARCKNVNGIG